VDSALAVSIRDKSNAEAAPVILRGQQQAASTKVPEKSGESTRSTFWFTDFRFLTFSGVAFFFKPWRNHQWMVAKKATMRWRPFNRTSQSHLL
jgi:hypothetical protein